MLPYVTLERKLIKRFNENNFIDCHNKKIQKYLPVKNKYGFSMKIYYPGYKTKIQGGKVTSYDYRVELNNIAVSHVNIVVDLYAKSVQAPHLRKDLEEFIIDLGKHGLSVDMKKFLELSKYRFQPPNEDILNSVNDIHKKLEKIYLIQGNKNKCYSIEELSLLIPLIVMQEDINYPMPTYQGRRMSFYRYIEAINSNSEDILEEVIRRTLSHGRPQLWEDINYKEIIELK